MGKTNDKRRWIIYMYTFPNGKRYIGKTCRTLKDRQDGSKWRGYRGSPVLWNAIQKYGVANIKQDILFEDYMTYDDSDRLEMTCIALFKTNCNRYNNPAYGYNCDDGGGGMPGFHHSEETKEKLRQAHIGKHDDSKLAKPVVCIELKKVWKSMSVAAKETGYGLKKISSVCNGELITIGGYHWILVNDFSADNIKKILMKDINKRYASIICVDTNKFYQTIKDASLDTNIGRANIGACVRGISKTAGGYYWRYATEAEKEYYYNNWSDNIISRLLGNEELMNEINKFRSGK